MMFHSMPVRSLMLFYHRFLCLPLRLPPGAVPTPLHTITSQDHTSGFKKDGTLNVYLSSTADITSGPQFGRAEVLRSMRNVLNMDIPEHHRTDRLEERGVEKGSGRHPTLQGRERFVFNQTNIGTVSRATLGRLLRDGAERVWAFPCATMPS